MRVRGVENLVFLLHHHIHGLRSSGGLRLVGKGFGEVWVKAQVPPFDTVHSGGAGDDKVVIFG